MIGGNRASRGAPPFGERVPPFDARRRIVVHAVVERAVPELVERSRAVLSREELAPPELAHVRIEIRRLAQPLQQAVLRRACVEQRRDRRLREAERSGDRFSVAPGLEEVVIGAHGVACVRGLVRAIGERDRQGHRLHASREPFGVREVVQRVDAVRHQHLDVAAVHRLDQLLDRRVVALSLERRRVEIDGHADISQQRVDRVHDNLRRRIVGSADDERPATVAPQIVGRPIDRPIVDRDLHTRQRFGHARVGGDTMQERERDRALLGRRDRDAPIGIAARERNARLELVMLHAAGRQPFPASIRVLPGEFNRRQPRAEEVGLDADDGFRAIEAVMRNGRDAETGVRGFAKRAERHGVVHDVAEAWKARRPFRDQRSRRRAHDRARQKDDSAAARGGDLRLHARVDLAPRRGLAVPQRTPEAIRVVQRQHRRLTCRARAAAEAHRFSVALDLDRPSVARLDEQRAGGRAAGARGRIPAGDPGRHFFRLVEERNRLLHRGARTARDRRRGEREAEPREEIATAVVPFGGPIPEFQIVRHVSNGTCRNRDSLPARSGRRLASGDSRCTIPSSAATAVRPASSARRGRDTTGSRWRPTGADCG